MIILKNKKSNKRMAMLKINKRYHLKLEEKLEEREVTHVQG